MTTIVHAVKREQADDEAQGDAGGDDGPNPLSASDTAESMVPAAATSTRRRWRRDRISKWDRPPEPHDWRFFVGHLGRILISTGLLLFLFVAYQLWGTGIETARAQNSLESEFEQMIASNVATTDAPSTAVSTTVPSTTAPPTTVPVTTIAAAQPDDTTPTTTAPEYSKNPVTQNLPPVNRDAPLARLQIPTIDLDWIVVPGVTVEDLKDGPGHFPETPLPGQLGNSAIAGHRTTHGAPFFDVNKIEPGAEIIVTMGDGLTYVYVVSGSEIVSPADTWVVQTANPNIAELTLISCDPAYTARNRIVIHSELNPERSAQVGVPTFYDLGSNTTPASEDSGEGASPNDDSGESPTLSSPTLSEGLDAEDAATSTTAVGSPGIEDEGGDEGGDDVAGPVAGAGAETDGDSASPGNTPAGPESDSGFVSAPVSQPDDAFSQGWFEDDEAFPQIALWGVMLALISIGAYMLSRKTRHDSIGFLVGIAPFMFCLYFFFQNVNRLLPPGI